MEGEGLETRSRGLMFSTCADGRCVIRIVYFLGNKRAHFSLEIKLNVNVHAC